MLGPLIDAPALAKVEEHIADAVAKGASIVQVAGGTFYEATVLADVPPTCSWPGKKRSAPLAPLFRLKDEADVIAQANDTEFGLASYFCAKDLSRAFRVPLAVHVGTGCEDLCLGGAGKHLRPSER